MAFGRRGRADHGLSARDRRQAAAVRRAARRRAAPPGSASGPGLTTRRSRRRSRRGRRAPACRCSRSRTRCRSSRSPSAPRPGWSTSSMRCSSAATQVHERLERLVIEGRGLEEILASTAGGDRRRGDRRRPGRRARSRAAGEGRAGRAGRRGAQRRDRRRGRGRRAGCVRATGGRARRAGAGGPGSRPARRRAVAWLVVVSDRGQLGEFERLCARQAAIVVGLELMRERVVHETERRLAGDLLADALGGRLEPEELRGRLRPFGIGGEAAVLVFELDDPPAAEATLESALADAGVPALVATSAAAGRPLLCAVIDAGADDPIGAARQARDSARRRAGPERRPRRRQPRRRRSARCAAPSTRRAARSRRPRSPTATPRTSPRTATSAPSRCCSRCRTTTRCASTATACSSRSSAPRASTAASCCARSRRSSSNNGNWERAARAALLPPPHAALSDPQDRGADRARSEPGDGSDRALVGADGQGSWSSDEGRSSDRDQARRVPGRDHADRRPRAAPSTATRSLIQAGAGEGSAISDSDYEAQGARILPDRRGRLRRGRDGARGQGAPAAGGRDAAARARRCSPTCTWRRRRS